MVTAYTEVFAMVEKNEGKKLLPPYVPYRTFANFLAGKRSPLPQKIDRSLMTSMSGAMQSQTLLALEYLKLVDPLTWEPTETLERLVQVDDSDKHALWKEILISSYHFVFEQGFQLERATPSELQDRFSKTGASGSTLRKCIAFFIKATKEANLQLSPYLTKITRTRTKAAKSRIKANSSQESQNGFVEPKPELAAPGQVDERPKTLLGKLADRILEKYPDFDPSWPEDQQASWFEGMNKLMSQFEKKSGGE